MNWQLLITISVITNSIGVILQRVLMKDQKRDSLVSMIIFQLVCALIITFWGVFFTESNYSTLWKFDSILIPILIIITNTFYSIGSLFVFKAIQKLSASKFTILFSLRAAVTVLVSSVFLGQFLNFQQLLGAILVFISIVLVTVNKLSELKRISKGELFGIFAALSFGIAISIDSYVINFVDIFPYLSLGFLYPGIFMMLVYPRKIKELVLISDIKFLVSIIIFCCFYTISAVTFLYSIQLSTNSSLISSINQVGTILTVILGIVLLKERDNLLKKIFGGLICFIGLILLV